MSSAEIPNEVRNSRWWYLIAAVPIIDLLVFSVVVVTFFLVFALGRTRILGFGETTIAMVMAALSIVIFVSMLMLPYALHRDLKLLEEYITLDRWRFDRHQYLIAAVAGIFFPILGFGVAFYYLYQRHHHIGVP